MIRSVRNLVALESRLRSAVGADAARQHSARTAPPAAPAAAGTPAAPAPPPRPVVESRALLDRAARRARRRRRGARQRSAARRQRGSAAFYTAEGQPPVNRAERAARLRAPRVAGVLQHAAHSDRRRPHVHRRRADADVAGRDRQRARRQALLAWTGSDRQAHQVRRLAIVDQPVADDRRRGRRGEVSRPAGESDRGSGHLPAVRRSQFARRRSCVRTTVPPSSLVATVRADIRAADPSIPVYNVATMDELSQRADVAVALHDVADGRLRGVRADRWR